MALSVKHAFQSAKSDGIDTTLVQPSNWNAEHTILLDPFTLVARGTGSGAASAISMDVIGIPLGMPCLWPINSNVPSNFVLMAGQAISRATYADLFALWSTTFGSGDGSTTFNVPDWRGRTVFGRDNMNGTAAGRLTSTYGLAGNTIGATGGSQVGDLPQHGHTVIDPGHDHALLMTRSGNGTTGPTTNYVADDAGGVARTSGGPTNIAIAVSGVTNASRIPPAVVANWIVKALRT